MPRTEPIPKTEAISEGVGAKEQSEQEVEVAGPVPAGAVRAPGFDSSFDDRFSAVGDGGPPGSGSKLQQVIDLFSGRANDP
jgi:hypothetical protein